MKDLQQAVNLKRWPGNGEAAKPWGKLKQVGAIQYGLGSQIAPGLLDPEIWDERGDTLIYFNRGRPDAAFRISSILFRDTGSETLIDMLLYGTVRSEASTRGVSYKIYLEPPSSCEGKLAMLRYHITTRNFFAFLLGKPIVGFSFYQALDDLLERLEKYLAPVIDCKASLKAFLVATGLVNVSNQPCAAIGLLAWSEEVRWTEGWREAFVHAVGMYQQIERMNEKADLSPATQAHLQRAHLEIRIRVQEAEDRLSSFSFDEGHNANRDKSSTTRAASYTCRKFLKQFYEKRYQSWPPRADDYTGLWLDRNLICRLQQDFAALYEYCVDKTVVWKGNENEYNEKLGSRRPQCLVQLGTGININLDIEDDRMLGVLQNLGRVLKASDIPQPFPLLPESIPASAAPKKGVFGKGKKDKLRESRVMHAYVEASNAVHWHREFASNDLAKAFVAFEQSENIDTVDPRAARRGRWIIICCILQTLAGIAVDVPHLSFKNDVNYFLNPRLRGLPPWDPGGGAYREADREFSYCWNAFRQRTQDRFPAALKGAIGFDSQSGNEEGDDSRPLSVASFHAQELKSELSIPENGSVLRAPSALSVPMMKGLSSTTPSLFSTSRTLNGAQSTISSRASSDYVASHPAKVSKMPGIRDREDAPITLRPKHKMEAKHVQLLGLG